MGLIKKWTSKWNIQSTIVSLCLLFVCIGTQQIQTVKWDTGKIDFFRDSLGVVISVILFTHYKWSNIIKYKLPYIVWTIVGVVSSTILVPIISARRAEYLLADTLVIALGIFLMGYCVIYTLIQYFVEKTRPKLFVPLFIIWVVMLVLMIFSRSEYWWPECYFVLFLCYYMTGQTQQQRTNVIQGVIYGIILGFVVIQAHALLCRPYDLVRYQGNFCNPNHNCMFLCMCLVAILAKILFLCGQEGKKLWKVFFFLLAGMCYALIVMTISRSGYLAAVVATVFFLIGYCRIVRKRVFIRMGILLVVLFATMLPVTYLAVRYVPTIHPHVLFYFQEGYSEDRVHSWDARDSEKFVDFEEMMQAVFGRLFSLSGEKKDHTVAMEEKPLLVVSNANSLPVEYVQAVRLTAIGAEVDPDKIPVLTKEDGSNAFEVRYAIYKWYFTHLSLRGMPYDEQGFQLTADHWIQDTHNIYLDYGINFGYPVMILFTVFIWWGIGRLTHRGWKEAEPEVFTCLLIALVPPVFGMFEFAWGAGMLSTVAFYLVFKEMFNDCISK